MAHTSDSKYAKEMEMDVEQVRKLIKRLDISFFSSGKGEGMVYMFDADELEEKLQDMKTAKKDRRRGPRKTKKGAAKS